MGPFTLLDFVGLDTTYYICQIMFDEFKESVLPHRLCSSGWYWPGGRQESGRGFTTTQIPPIRSQ